MVIEVTTGGKRGCNMLGAQHHDGRPAVNPGVGFGLTLIASAVVLFFSVARPQSQRLPDVVWEVDEALTLRKVAVPALLHDKLSSDGRFPVGDGDVWQDEEIWASFGMITTTTSPPRRQEAGSSAAGQNGAMGGTGSTNAQGTCASPGATRERVGNTGMAVAGDHNTGEADSSGPEPRQGQMTSVGQASGDTCEHSLFCATWTPTAKRKLGVNVSLIPGTGWGHLGYEIFFGLYHDKEGLGWEPLLLGEVHPAGGFEVKACGWLVDSPFPFLSSP